MAGKGKRRLVLRVLLAAIVCLLAAVGVGYRQAVRPPEGYRPPALSPRQRQDAVSEFTAHVVADFNNRAQRPEVFTWSITEEQFNTYLASVDEIASALPNVRPGQVRRAMQGRGIADPTVALRDGRLTFMVGLVKQGVVVSADLKFRFDAERKMAVDLAAAHIGRLRVPVATAEAALARLRDRLVPAGRNAGTARGVRGLLPQVIAAIDQEPFFCVVPVMGHEPARVEAVEIADGRLTLTVRPIGRKAPASGRSR